jgi:MFS superfamily sulfate permease-like transporter
MLQGLLPINPAQVPQEIIAGLTLAALAIPEVMGYTKIAGTPVITGLYTILIPVTLPAQNVSLSKVL